MPFFAQHYLFPSVRAVCDAVEDKSINAQTNNNLGILMPVVTYVCVCECACARIGIQVELRLAKHGFTRNIPRMEKRLCARARAEDCACVR